MVYVREKMREKVRSKYGETDFFSPQPTFCWSITLIYYCLWNSIFFNTHTQHRLTAGLRSKSPISSIRLRSSSSIKEAPAWSNDVRCCCCSFLEEEEEEESVVVVSSFGLSLFVGLLLLRCKGRRYAVVDDFIVGDERKDKQRGWHVAVVVVVVFANRGAKANDADDSNKVVATTRSSSSGVFDIVLLGIIMTDCVEIVCLDSRIIQQNTHTHTQDAIVVVDSW